MTDRRPLRQRIACCVGWLSVWLVGLSVGPAADARAWPAEPGVRVDSQAVTVRRPPAEALEAYRADPAFRYDREAVAPAGPSLWERFWRWVGERLEPAFSPRFAPLRRAVAYALVVALLFYAVTRLLRMEGHALFRREPGVRGPDFEVIDEDVHAIDFAAEIERAVAAEQYRRAVRLLYLRALKHLADEGLIVWTRDKTNRVYLAEVRRGTVAELVRAFEEATTLFEYVWYGDAPIDRSRFDQARVVFADVERRLKTAGVTA